MFIQSYLQTAQNILQSYNGAEPFSSFLKKFFSTQKKFGSRDRKYITHLCYCFFRLGRSLPAVDVMESMLIGLFLCSKESHPVLEAARPQWNEAVTGEIADKEALLRKDYNFRAEDILSLEDVVSPQINYSGFARSFLIQPDTFIRIRPGNQQIVQDKLTRAGIVFQQVNTDCLAVAPSTKIEEVLLLNKEAVIQDLSSQQVLDSLLPLLVKDKKLSPAWDCCAASGGKSILLFDKLPGISLTVTDIRESILINLRKRFQQAGIRNYQSFAADISAQGFSMARKFGLILCDVPCTGSGTWSRTPEQLYFFNKEKMEYYAGLQREIVRNACKSLLPGGLLVYITCSVFKKENEENVSFIQNNLSLQLLDMHYIKGYRQKADTLFTALFINE